ncbi:MAG: DUF2007 domain-containing protein [Flavobacterium sp.]
MAFIKIFSGSEIMALALKDKIEAKEVKTLVKNNIQSGIIVGIGTLGQAVEVFIDERDFMKVSKVIEDFKMNF